MTKNSRELTSHFDIHATLIWLLERLAGTSLAPSGTGYGNEPSIYKGLSMMSTLPKEIPRSCKDAGVPAPYCPCIDWLEARIIEPEIYRAMSKYPTYWALAYSTLASINDHIEMYFSKRGLNNPCIKFDGDEAKVFFAGIVTDKSSCFVKFTTDANFTIEAHSKDCVKNKIQTVEVYNINPPEM
jgi:hypothetical protein